MMFGRSEEASASSSASSWAASSAPEQPVTSKADKHARITRSILPTRYSPPPLVGAAPALPESLFNPRFRLLLGTPPGLAIMISTIGILCKDLPFLAGLPAYEVQLGTLATTYPKRGTARHALPLVQPRREPPSPPLQCARLL